MLATYFELHVIWTISLKAKQSLDVTGSCTSPPEGAQKRRTALVNSWAISSHVAVAETQMWTLWMILSVCLNMFKRLCFDMDEWWWIYVIWCPFSSNQSLQMYQSPLRCWTWLAQMAWPLAPFEPLAHAPVEKIPVGAHSWVNFREYLGLFDVQMTLPHFNTFQMSCESDVLHYFSGKSRGGTRPRPNCRLRKIFFAQWQVWMEYIGILMLSCPTFALKASPTRWERTTSTGSKPAPKGQWRFWRLWKWNKLRRCRCVYLQRRDGLQNAQPYRIS